jgi:4-hydroxy-3-methylbut-2-enyl diphosphate reductase
MVKEIHKIAQDMEKKGYTIIIIGDKKHNEVLGIAGQLKNKAIIIDELRNIRLQAVKRIKKACVVVQSTQNLQKVMGIIEALKPHIKELKFFNTICGPTRKKQAEIKKMPLENDAMIIIGSKTSANTKRLYEISKSINEKSFWIQTKKDINLKWFRGAKYVGVTAGASTPGQIIKETVEYLNSCRKSNPRLCGSRL